MNLRPKAPRVTRTPPCAHVEALAGIRHCSPHEAWSLFHRAAACSSPLTAAPYMVAMS